jgi:antiviral helicase SKI2
LTELILDNTFASYEPEEVVALLSCFIFQEKTEVEPLLTPKLEQGKSTILEVAERVLAVQTKHRANFSEEGFNGSGELKFGLTEVVYEWAKGMVRVSLSLFRFLLGCRSSGARSLTKFAWSLSPLKQTFSQITSLTDVQEGTIVRAITRLDETCREVRDAARIVGNSELFTKMEQCQLKIRRDIVFAASLYFSGATTSP